MPRNRIGNPRGLLHRENRARPFRHVRYEPREELRPFVEHFWLVSWDLGDRPPFVQEVLSHPSIQLVLEGSAARVVGVVRGLFSRRLEGKGGVFGVKFRPGGFRPFLGRPVRELTDRVVPAREVFGDAVDALARDVRKLRGPERRIRLAEAFLGERLPGADPQVETAGRVCGRIREDSSLTRVDDLARGEGCTPRRLQRLFRDYVGATPKWVIRRYRLHEAVARLEEGTVDDWAALALELGFFDQAHFIRDFRTAVGTPPGAYARGRA